MYRHIRLNFSFENNVDYNSDYNSHFFTKLRSGTMKLNVEDEYLFTLVCPVYRFVRLQFLLNCYCSWTNVTKLRH